MRVAPTRKRGLECQTGATQTWVRKAAAHGERKNSDQSGKRIADPRSWGQGGVAAGSALCMIGTCLPRKFCPVGRFLARGSITGISRLALIRSFSGTVAGFLEFLLVMNSSQDLQFNLVDHRINRCRDG